MIIDNNGVSLHVIEDGNPDGPTVLMLHGITGSVDTWNWLVPSLADDYRVLRLDFRGHGQSGRAEGTYDFPSYVSDAIAVCEQVAASPCVVIGHSLGGGTAAGMTQLRPELVRGLILEEPAIMGPPAPGAESSASGLMDAFTMMRQMVPMMQQSGMTVDALAQTMAVAPSLSGGTMGEALQPDALAAMATALLQLDATVLDPVLNGSITTVYQPTVTLAVPGVVLAGDSSQPDTIVRAGEIAALAEHSPHIDVRVIAGAGHLIHDSLEHRATMLAAIQEFLAANAS
jgi:pimeloyl-ACP methyl ester carboxylesterase